MMRTPRWDDQGLVPVVAQDARTGRVLMLAYADSEALEATRRSGRAHFWSRSRRSLWQKGATSGNAMEVVDIRLDCDSDALLYVVNPAGPACHRETDSCFSEPADPPAQGFAWLEELWKAISARASDRPEGSYTARLLAAGVDGPGRKVAEEAVELVLAAKDHGAGTCADARVAEEAGDLLYHVLVLLAERGISPAQVIEVLESRAG